MKINDIKEELKYVFTNTLTEYLGKSIDKCSDDVIIKKFNDYAKTSLKKIKIKDLIDNYSNKAFYINTPDGLQEAGDFYIKGPKYIHHIKTFDYHTSCSDDHAFESSKSWKFAKNLKIKDLILSKDGYQEITENNISSPELVYDLEVLHDSHRYWSGNGLSSHNTGKTFLAMSITRNAQKMGYIPIYCDTEGSIDIEFTRKLGVDTSNIRLQMINTIEEMNHMMAQIVSSFEATIAKGQTPPKIMVVLDSLGNLTSLKEKTDSISGSDKRDMTKQQGIRKMFRVNGVKFAKLGIPFVVTNHVYDAMSLFTSKEISGGMGLKYNASIIFVLGKGNIDVKEETSKQGKAELKKKGLDEKTKIGITVYCKPFKGRFARPIMTKIYIPFYKKPNPYVGLETFLNWDDFGVIRGKILVDKEFAKLTEDEKNKCFEWEAEVEVKSGRGASATFSKEMTKVHVQPKDGAKTLVVKHLKGETSISNLFTDIVFTDELLKELDEKVIKPTFTLPDINSLEDLAELEKELFNEEELNENEKDQ